MAGKLSTNAGQHRHEEIAKQIRQRIIQQEYQPGMGLPTHRELMKEYGVGDLTMRQAIAALVEDGFLTTTQRRGTFVTDNPPHLTHIGVVFPFPLTAHQQWAPFYAGLADEALALAQSTPYRASMHASGQGNAADEEYLRLRRDIEMDKFAGLIFTYPPYDLFNKDLLHAHGIPQVAITSYQHYADIPGVVWFDIQSFTDKAVEFLAAQGRRNIAMLTTSAPGPPDSYADHFRASMAKHQIDVPAFWVQESSTDVRSLVHLLMQAEQSRRPDALIVTEDTVLEQALAGLIAAGVRVPDDVMVITHANFPRVVPSMLPVTRLGYDVRQVFHTCVALIDAQRRGKTIPMVTRIPATFESELTV